MIEVKQLNDREEWLRHRTDFIGGSDASCIVGMNPYKSNVELWEEKTGQREAEDISEKPYVKYGTEAEPHLRSLFALDFPEYVVGYIENNSITNDKYPWGAASLDGILIEKATGRKGILEIKTTNILQSMQREKWNGRIPDNYFCQVLHYLAVTEYDFAILTAQLTSKYEGMIYKQTKNYRIERQDVKDEITYLMDEERKFWDHVKNRTKPALLLPEI